MAETIMNCPGCVRQLRIPSEMMGRSLRCPNCATTFTVPVPSQATEAANDVRQKILASCTKTVRPPAVALMLVAAATFLGGIADSVIFYYSGLELAEESVDRYLPHRTELALFSWRLALAIRGLFAVASLLVLVSAVQMFRLRWRPFALFGSLVAVMLFCPIFCYPLNLPVGVWCMMALMRPEMRAAFR